MRIERWNPNAFDQSFEDVAMDRLLSGAYVVKDASVRKLRGHIGSGKTTGISRPVYKSGPYKGEPWTARDFGALLKSIRVVQKTSKTGKPLYTRRNIRVYAGHFLAYYSAIFEYEKPFMRPAFYESIPEVKSIMGAR